MLLHRLRRQAKGFTLIELLIVVAIIGILAAIAIPNLLSAQKRAKISRALADTKTIVSQTQLYNNDFNAFPTLAQLMGQAPGADGTTRVYVSPVFDPFGATATPPQPYGYGVPSGIPPTGPIWALSVGPPGGGATPPAAATVATSTGCSGPVGFQTDLGAITITVTGC